MEALSSSGLQIKRLSDKSLGIQTAKTSNKHCSFLRISPAFNKAPSLQRVSPVSALAREVSDEGEEDSRLTIMASCVWFPRKLSISQEWAHKTVHRKTPVGTFSAVEEFLLFSDAKYKFNVQRISFEDGLSVETLEEAKKALWRLMNGG